MSFILYYFDYAKYNKNNNIMTREELKSKIPHGYAQIVAKKAGVNRITVSNFLNGKSDNILVELAALEVIAELSEKKNALLARIN